MRGPEPVPAARRAAAGRREDDRDLGRPDRRRATAIPRKRR
jgi:hypothetical protein